MRLAFVCVCFVCYGVRSAHIKYSELGGNWFSKQRNCARSAQLSGVKEYTRTCVLSHAFAQVFQFVYSILYCTYIYMLYALNSRVYYANAAYMAYVEQGMRSVGLSVFVCEQRDSLYDCDLFGITAIIFHEWRLNVNLRNGTWEGKWNI